VPATVHAIPRVSHALWPRCRPKWTCAVACSIHRTASSTFLVRSVRQVNAGAVSPSAVVSSDTIAVAFQRKVFEAQLPRSSPPSRRRTMAHRMNRQGWGGSFVGNFDDVFDLEFNASCSYARAHTGVSTDTVAVHGLMGAPALRGEKRLASRLSGGSSSEQYIERWQCWRVRPRSPSRRRHHAFHGKTLRHRYWRRLPAQLARPEME
jgi:hypothetical protein